MLAGDRYSPLKRINRSNVARLKPICTYTLPEVSSLQTGPIVVDGTMFFTTHESSYAINAKAVAISERRDGPATPRSNNFELEESTISNGALLSQLRR